MKKIVSVSRRTDIPAYYADWFVRRLDAGTVSVRQPFNGRFFSVSLRPEDVRGFVFWSKNFRPLMPHLARIEQTSPNLLFHYTITGVPPDIEPGAQPFAEPAECLRELSRRYGPGRVIWRFDPIVVTDRIPFDHYRGVFRLLAGLLRGAVRECTISFVDPYRKVLRNFAAQSDHMIISPRPDEQREYAGELGAIAAGHGIRLCVCCNPDALGPGVEQAHCIDPGPFAGDAGGLTTVERAPTRKGCGCTKSIDIGAYDTCPHGCLYCYANANGDKAKAAFNKHVPSREMLGFTATAAP